VSALSEYTLKNKNIKKALNQLIGKQSDHVTLFEQKS
jgi:hypothetical protein